MSPSAQREERQLTCFVVMGFGRKVDYATGRVLDLDKTYEQLIRPAFDRVGVNAFRAIDANLTGSIDSIMYRWIYEADIVIADLSTLNANVFYELGVRHAQKPNTTIIIAESVLMSKIPFDLSSFVIHQYHHGGDEIAEEEQERFVAHLEGIQKRILDPREAPRDRDPGAKIEGDSPVFTFLPGIEGPSYEAETAPVPPRYIPPEERQKDTAQEGESLASTIDAAEEAKGRKDFPEAIRLFRKAIDTQVASKKATGQETKPDVFLAQRLAVVTYKNGETKNADGNIDKERAIAALGEAEQILGRYCAPKISTDPETLGLSGAINKRLYDHTGDLEYLDRAIAFYERGFHVKQDYYNGINVAFMYTMRSLLVEDRFESIFSYGQANRIRRQVGEICREIIDDEEEFQKRGDKEWVLMTLAEVYQGLGRSDDEQRLARKIEAEASDWGIDAYMTHKARLATAIEEFERRMAGPEAAREPEAEAERPGPTIFISSTQEDAAMARKLLHKLKQAGFEPWMDTESLRGGDRWEQQIVSTIRKVDFFVVLNSRALAAAGRKASYVNKEINTALDVAKLEQRGFIVPVTLDDEPLIEPLSGYQSIRLDVDGPKALVRAIKKADAQRRAQS